VTSRNYTTEGIILARRNYSEADRILSIYTKHFGRLSYIAKGIRRPTSRKRGHLEVFSYIKFQGSRGKGLDILTEVETIDNFREIRTDLKKTALAFYFVEVIGRTTHEGAPNSELFSLILANLKKLTFEEKLLSLKNRFIVDVLTSLGFWPKGVALANPEDKLLEVTERDLGSSRVGKKLIN